MEEAPANATAKPRAPKVPWWPALLVTLAWLALALFLLPAYGPTWDCAECEFPYGERLLHAFTSDDFTLTQAIEAGGRVPVREPHPEYVMSSPWWVSWPVTAFLSAASCRVFWGELGWLGPIEAHHLPIVLFTALLVLAIVRFATVRASIGAGIAAGLFLLTSPRFFADSFNNAKDVPEACLYTIAAFAGLRALERGRRCDWLLTGALAGAALAQKANAVFLAPQLLLTALAFLVLRVRLGGGLVKLTGGAIYALVATAVLYFALSPPLWLDPIGHLEQQFEHVSGTGSIAVKADRAGFSLGERSIDWDGPAHALWTTPIALMAFASIGLLASRLRREVKAFLLIGTVVPIGRVALPGMTNFDGVRHFIEYLPPLCVLAGAGLDRVASAVASIAARRARLAYGLVLLAAIAPGAVATARTHPNGICWYNALVGGLQGAQARGVRDSTDYWCNSYRQAAPWLREHAEEGARLLVPVARHVMSAIAPLELREDLRILRPNERQPPKGVLYVCYATRRSLYGPLIRGLEAGGPPAFEIRCDGAPIFKAYRLEDDAAIAAGKEWKEEIQLDFSLRRLYRLTVEQPGLAQELSSIFEADPKVGRDETLRRLREILPPDLHPSLPRMLEEAAPGEFVLPSRGN